MKQYRLDTDRMKVQLDKVHKKETGSLISKLSKFMERSVRQLDRDKKGAPSIINALKHYEETTGDSITNIIKECVEKKK